MKTTPIALVVGVGCALAASDAQAHGRACVEVSDVVGDKKCSAYGDEWSIERKVPATFRFGMRYADFSVGGLGFDESFKRRNRPKGYSGYSYRGEALGLSTVSALGVDGGAAIYVWGQLYLGIEGGFSLGSTTTGSFQTSGVALSDAAGIDVVMLHGGIPIGYRVPLGRASIRGEFLFGATGVSLTHDVRALVPERAPAGGTTSAGRWLIEPRIAADVWFTQHISMGAYAGVNMLDYGGRVFGISLTFHNRAFDGDMSIW